MGPLEQGTFHRLFQARRQIVTLALGAILSVAAVLIWPFEAWAAIPLVGLAVAVIVSGRWPVDHGGVIRAAVGIGLSLALGAAGAFMVLLSLYGPARPCDACTDNVILLMPGIGTLIVAIVLLAICARSISRLLGGDR